MIHNFFARILAPLGLSCRYFIIDISLLQLRLERIDSSGNIEELCEQYTALSLIHNVISALVLIALGRLLTTSFIVCLILCLLGIILSDNALQSFDELV